MDPLPLEFETLERLLEAPFPATVRLAIRELPRADGERAIPHLLRLLKHPRVPIQKAAARSLTQCSGGLATILKSHDHPEFEEQRALLRASLSLGEGKWTDCEILSLLEPLLQDPMSATERTSQLILLATAHKSQVNSAVQARVGELIKLESWELALQLLEPLVRHRLASLEGRIQLLTVHVRRAEKNHDSESARRAIQLALPLSRLSELDLHGRLLRDGNLDASDLEFLSKLLLSSRRKPADSSAISSRERKP
jgi:hypothetical protein